VALTADMVDEGTGSLSAIDVSDALARIGADYDVDVGGDATRFSLTTITRFAMRGASLLADMVTRPSHREHDFTRVHQLRLDRLLQLKDVPSAVAEQVFLALVYGDHPYGHLAIGDEASLTRLSLDDLVSCHRQLVQPHRSTLVVCGAMRHDDLLRLASEAFLGWASSTPEEVAAPPADREPTLPPNRRLVVVPREGAAQSELRIGRLTTRRVTPDYSALLVLNAVLGGQFVSRINLKLREEKGYTYGARTGFDWRRGVSPFSLQTSVGTATTADAVADALAEIAALRGDRPPRADELALAKASLTRGYPRGFETAQQVARSVTQLALYGLPDSYFAEFVPRVHAVTSEQVVAAAERYLDPSTFVTLIVGDLSAIAESLPRLGLGEPEVRQAGL
jgi:predicted Zn-dependent peptidase